jgi:hypothetical protein
MATPGNGVESSLRAAAVALAAVAVAVLAVLFALRVGAPFELEWMEGAMVDHAIRVAHGLPIYTAPSLDHVAYLYTPLLYWLGALLMPICGESLLSLRLVSVAATVACAWLIASWARREGAGRGLAFAAAGLFAAGYGYLQSWYDLARNDTLFVACLLAAAWLLRFAGRRAAWVAALCGLLAFLGKQTALMWLPALTVMAAFLDWRKAVLFAAASVAAIGGTVLAMHLASDGWSTFFVFEMPRGHAIQPDRKLGFFTEDLVPLLPMTIGAGWLIVERWRRAGGPQALALAAFAGGGLLTSYLSRLHAGGFDNTLMYVFAAGCPLLPALAGVLTTPRARCAALLLLAAQFATLAVDVRIWSPDRPALLYDPRRFVPSPAQAVASAELVEFLRRQPGDVLVPFHGLLPHLAGKPAGAHAQALVDLLQRFQRDADNGGGSNRSMAALAALRDNCQQAMTSQRYSAIVLEEPHGKLFETWFAPWLTGYRRRPGAPFEHAADLRPLVGMITHSPYVLEPVR